MKKVDVNILFPILLLFTLFCSLTYSPESKIGDSPDYAKHWLDFKTAIAQKNEESLKERCTDQVTDIKGVLFMCTEIFVREKLDETSFDELESVEEQGVAYLKFYVDDIGIDEFGYEYASALTLYFLTTAEGLFLDKYSAAG